MEIVDLIIVIFLLFFAILGFKRGFFKSLVMFLGFIIVIVLSYMFKNYLGDFLVLNLPFISFGNFMGGAITLNIIMYQALAFIIVLAILSLAYKIIVTITGIFEKILKFTIILGIPSKILGLIVGIIEGYVIIYLVLFFLTQPFINLDILENSKYTKTILNDTPIISSIAENSLKVFNEVREVIEKKDNPNIDLEISDLILKEKVTSTDVMQRLVDKGKLKIDGIQNVIDKYKGDDSND